MISRWRGILLLMLLSVLIPQQTLAQDAIEAQITAPLLEEFPRIKTYLRVLDQEGNFLYSLKKNQVSVVEDGEVVPITSISAQRPGAQVVVSINPGPSFAVRNNQAVSRFDLVREKLTEWALSRRGSNIDDLSLLITNSQNFTHTADIFQWLEALAAVDIDLRAAVPSLDSLFRAVEIAADAPVRPGMGKLVLWVTPPPEGDAITAMDDLTNLAIQRNIPIFVWMVSSPGAFGTQGADQLARLAEESGGEFFAFSGVENLPEIEKLLEPYRNIFLLSYESRIRSGGTHQLFIRIQKAEGRIETSAQNFELTLLPPSPTFINPPIQIQRVPPQELTSVQDEIPFDDYLPKEQKIEIVVDFPDGRKREIEYAALRVDNQVVDKHTSPPFEKFTWDISHIQKPGSYILKVEVRDVFGLSGTSVDLPVFVTFEEPVIDPLSILRRNLSLLVSIFILFVGAIVILVLILGGKIHPQIPRARRKIRRKTDPLTQPVFGEQGGVEEYPQTWFDRLQNSEREIVPKAQAFLYRISDQEELASAPPIPISKEKVCFGRDANRADITLEDDSVEPVHAFIRLDQNGQYRIADEGSTAGTWVNYTPVSSEGTPLEHGDLVHFGRLGFRFMLRNPKRITRPIVIPQKNPKDEEEKP